MTPDELADRLDAAADNLGPEVFKAVKHAATLGRQMIRNNASGRPGPMVRSAVNNYRDSWESIPRALPHGGMATLGTKKPQGRRLEFGFVGPDSLGRIYNQPPFPHVGPAIPAMEALLQRVALAAVREVLS